MMISEAHDTVTRCRSDMIAAKGRIEQAVQTLQGAVKTIATSLDTLTALQAEYPDAVDKAEQAEWQAMYDAATAKLAEHKALIDTLLGG